MNELILKQDLTTGFYTIRVWANINKIKMDRNNTKESGKAVSKFCRENDIKFAKTGSEQDGFVNIYPLEVIDSVYPDFIESKINVSDSQDDLFRATKPKRKRRGK